MHKKWSKTWFVNQMIYLKKKKKRNSIWLLSRQSSVPQQGCQSELKIVAYACAKHMHSKFYCLKQSFCAKNCAKTYVELMSDTSALELCISCSASCSSRRKRRKWSSYNNSSDHNTNNNKRAVTNFVKAKKKNIYIYLYTIKRTRNVLAPAPL